MLASRDFGGDVPSRAKNESNFHTPTKSLARSRSMAHAEMSSASASVSPASGRVSRFESHSRRVTPDPANLEAFSAEAFAARRVEADRAPFVSSARCARCFCSSALMTTEPFALGSRRRF